MDLLLVRRAGSRPPRADALRTALQRQDWLTPDPIRRGPWARVFAFRGGQIHVATRFEDTAPYEAPGLRAQLLPDAEFTVVAPLGHAFSPR